MSLILSSPSINTPCTHIVGLDLKPHEAAPRLLRLPSLVLLDSSRAGGAMGRYSYLTADPYLTIRSWGRCVEVTDARGRQTCDANPWDMLQFWLARYRREAIPGLPPFQGGAAGYFGYDLGRHLERLPATAHDDLRLPELSMGFYDWVLSYDHEAERGWLVSTGLPGNGTAGAARARSEQIVSLLEQPTASREAQVPAPPRFRSNIRRDRYLEAVSKAKEYISAGAIYQVNLSQRLHAPWRGDPWTLYERLREVSPVPYGGYIVGDGVTLLSASPERFLRLDGRHIETRPIKGTRPRGATAEEDGRLAAELLASPKDRAENLMIVDLLRNDLGRVCETGSVSVPGMFALERYSNVWQLVSTVTGKLRPSLEAIDLLRAAFPGGSITGAPKIRAMEIIEELEPVRRGPYCGAIGYIDFSGAMDTSIVIRTPLVTGGNIYLQVGGGIVADSDPVDEYEESLAKARAGLAALEASVEEA